ARAQTPQVSIFADISPTWFIETGQTNRIRWYDPHGTYSVLGFHIVLETGNIVKVTQRLEKIDNDGDPNSLDEAYIESRGTWRIGKQYLPFGQRNLLNESAPAMRYDTELLFDAVPISIAASDNGVGYTRGVVARIGSSVGVSVAVGDHFAIQGSDLTQFQRPGSVPGRGRGYKKAYGLDTTVKWGGGNVDLEWVSLREGATPLDLNRNLSDVRYRFFTKGTGFLVTLAWARSWDKQIDWYRAFAEVPVSKNVTWEPFLRFRGLGWQDFGLTARVKL
ncbi:MAG TPA: hypothetical protein VNI20_07760, partial [Fimbriimonadaceae bacterium]|nr:hypothetical protein [Fimbriimonadaceae bacterium]